MRCEKAEKRISDALDGELSAGRQKRLLGHLKECAACRSYGEILKKIQRESQDLGKAGVGKTDWEAFSARLLGKLQTERPERALLRPGYPRWKWAWAGALLVALLVIGLVLVPRHGQAPEDYVFSMDAFFNRLDQEPGDDAHLEAVFENEVSSLIGAGKAEEMGEAWASVSNDPFFWESLSDEELSFIEEELEKEIKS